MVGHAQEEDPKMSCGLLAARQGAVVKHYRMTNVERSPYRFNMDSDELNEAYQEMKANGWELLAICYSIYGGTTYPSATTVELANSPEAYYVITSLQDRDNPTVRAFRIANRWVTEEPIETEDGTSVSKVVGVLEPIRPTTRQSLLGDSRRLMGFLLTFALVIGVILWIVMWVQIFRAIEFGGWLWVVVGIPLAWGTLYVAGFLAKYIAKISGDDT